MPLFKGNPHTFGMKFCHKTRVLGAVHSEHFVILACTVLTQYRSVTDGQTNRHLDDG